MQTLNHSERANSNNIIASLSAPIATGSDGTVSKHCTADTLWKNGEKISRNSGHVGESMNSWKNGRMDMSISKLETWDIYGDKLSGYFISTAATDTTDNVSGLQTQAGVSTLDPEPADENNKGTEDLPLEEIQIHPFDLSGLVDARGWPWWQNLWYTAGSMNRDPRNAATP